MLTGSMAMNYYAQPRMTRDIDIIVAVGPADADRMLSLFQSEYYVSRGAVVSAIGQRSMFNIIHNESVIKVDFIIKKESQYRSLEFARRANVMIDDFSVWIVSKEDLIISKLSWAEDSHSELQLRDVRNLTATGCDRAYVEKVDNRAWVGEIVAGMPSIKDTPPEVAEMVRARLMARSPEERFMMGVEMFEAARAMVLASLPKDLPPVALKRQLFERIYGFPAPEDWLK